MTFITTGTDREELIKVIKEYGCKKREKSVKLSSGGETWVYLDVKGILTTGSFVNLAADAMLDWISRLPDWGDVTAIGGPTMGADVLSIGMVSRICSGHWFKWFSVRDKVKTTHGLGRWIEGATLGPDDNVIITDDVASTGKSLIEAVQRVRETGARVAAVVPLVDRAGLARERLATIGVHKYLPLIGYEDLGLQPL